MFSISCSVKTRIRWIDDDGNPVPDDVVAMMFRAALRGESLMLGLTGDGQVCRREDSGCGDVVGTAHTAV